MFRNAWILGWFLIALTALLGHQTAWVHADAPPAELDKTDVAFFETHIRPLLIRRCYECHSTESGDSSGELRLDSAPAMQRGGTRGAVLVPGKPEASHLIRAVEYNDTDMQMPPDGKLPDAEIELLKAWVREGATDPRTEDTAEEITKPGSPMERDVESHWAFVGPERIDANDWKELPAGNVDAKSQDAIDEYAARHAAAQDIPIAAPADRHTLHRRLRYDLHGMPSSWESRQSFEQDRRPDAATRQINRMLADPMYGERMGRHWLDVARYADTRGYALAGKDRNLLGSHRFRDWTIDAFAEDMPYDEMIRHQLAGDVTDPENQTGNADAMGFLTLGRHFLSGDDTLDDRIDVIGRGLLGLTLACARCHDHKFDPIPTVDYYSLYNVLDNSVPPADLNTAASPLMLVDRDKLRQARIYIRGNRGNRGDIAPRRYLTAFRADDEPEFKTGSGRFDLAERIATSTNPLTARVMANRIWGYWMGRGIVDSASDFGFQTPSPELQPVLDELAADFADHWSVQRLVRRLVQTRIYQQSTQASALAAELDPDNRLWTHAQRKRRDFESMRDAILVGCDFLDTQIGGVSVEITEPRLIPRRTLYARIDRQNLPGLFRTFDFASPDMHSPERYYTTVPQQSLFLLNHPQLSDAADRAAAAAVDSAKSTPTSDIETSSINQLFISILGRPPAPAELADAEAFLRSPAQESVLAYDPRDLWKYGTGPWIENRLQSFEPLPVFKDNRWQAESEFPSKGPLGYASLSREDGHAARGNIALVRRWTSPIDGDVKVSGMVGHRSEQGDGIEAVIQVSGETIFRERQKSSNRPLPSLERKIQKGESVDLIVLSGESDSFDSFFWGAKVSVVAADGSRVESDSVNDFSGPYTSQASGSLDRLAQLAQVLYLSNEFAFID
ncbi:PSD1 and planctomycete cytochrome C domain-containing protein [Neorhodopirellula pilleata]|nr:PSD1 and planctomycete cytochrome C domain-containing protein [Neorhodopirellula pilleata]